MADQFLGGIFSSLSFGGGGIFTIFLIIGVAISAMIIIALIFWYFISRKQWNLEVEFKLPRAVKYLNTGESIDINNVQGFIDAEWGKGSYNHKRGTVFLKRKGKKKIPMKPFNITRYLQGKKLTVVQTGANDYAPVIPESYLIYTDDKTGEECALLNLKADTSESRSWKSSFEREAKQAFSILTLLREYAPYIAIGLVIFLWGIQMLLLYNRIK